MKTIILQTLLQFSILFSLIMIVPYIFMKEKESVDQFIIKTLVILLFSIGIGIRNYLKERGQEDSTATQQFLFALPVAKKILFLRKI